VHDGIIVINFTEGKRRNKAKALGSKKAIGNEFLGNALFPGLMPFTAAKRQATSYCEVLRSC